MELQLSRLSDSEEELLTAIDSKRGAVEEDWLAAHSRYTRRELRNTLEKLESAEVVRRRDDGGRTWLLTKAGRTFVDDHREELTPPRTIGGTIERVQRLERRVARLESRLEDGTS